MTEKEDAKASMLTYEQFRAALQELAKEGLDGAAAEAALEALVRRCDPMELWRVINDKDQTLWRCRVHLKPIIKHAIAGPTQSMRLVRLVDDLAAALGMMTATAYFRASDGQTLPRAYPD